MTNKKNTTKSWAFLPIIGLFALFGYFVGSYAARSGVDLPQIFGPSASTSHAVAMGIATIYLLVGILLLIAVASPRLAEGMLKGADSQDIIDNPPMYALQAFAMVSFGLALAVVASAGEGAVLSPRAGGIGFAVLMLAGCIAYWRSLPLLDELLKVASIESAALTYGGLLLLIGTWAAYAHLGFLTAPTMLDLLSAFWGVSLVATLVASARRGMIQD